MIPTIVPKRSRLLSKSDYLRGDRDVLNHNYLFGGNLCGPNQRFSASLRNRRHRIKLPVISLFFRQKTSVIEIRVNPSDFLCGSRFINDKEVRNTLQEANRHVIGSRQRFNQRRRAFPAKSRRKVKALPQRRAQLHPKPAARGTKLASAKKVFPIISKFQRHSTGHRILGKNLHPRRDFSLKNAAMLKQKQIDAYLTGVQAFQQRNQRFFRSTHAERRNHK